MSYGNTSGRAVVLPRREERSPMVEQPTQLPAAEPGYETPEYIQMDGMGMHEEYLSLVNQLTDFRAQMKSQGYNPDVRPRDAFGQKMYDQYQLMKNAVDVGTQRLAQGYKNEQAMMEAYYDGDVALDLSRAGSGPYSSQDALNATMRLDFDPVKKYNDVIGSFDPNTTEGAQAIAQYKQDALLEIDQLVSQGFISREAGDLYKSEIGVPATYNTSADDHRRAATAETYQRMRHAKEDRQAILAEAVPLLQVLSQVGPDIDGLRNSTSVDGRPIVMGDEEQMGGGQFRSSEIYRSTESSTSMAGHPLMGDDGFISEEIRADNDGLVTLVFRPSKRGETEVSTNISERMSGTNGAKITTNSQGQVEVSFRRDNILPMYRAILPDKEYNEFRQALQRDGYLRDGVLTEEDVKDYIRRSGGDPEEVIRSYDPMGRGAGSSSNTTPGGNSGGGTQSQSGQKGRSLNQLRTSSSAWTEVNFNQ